VLTCDAGVDDAIALAVAAGRPDCRVAAVVAGAGNVAAATAWRNAAGMAALLGLDGPVAIGGERTIGGAPIHRAGDGHGADGLLGLADRLPRPAAATPADGLALVRGDVVALGPLTDTARAIRAGQPVDRVVWMGGSTGAGAAEFNASVDAEAVDAVLQSSAAVAVVPIDITRRVLLGDDDLARWSAGSATGRLCAELAARRRERTSGAPGVAVHDAVAVIAALEPALFLWSPRRLAARPAGGRLSSRPGPPNAELAVAVDADAVRRRIVDAVAAVPARPVDPANG
jgi:inosine-uridine nucleoside N-ribohydrolase